MSDQSRREFLFTAGTTIASANIVAAGRQADDICEQAQSEPDTNVIPPHREQNVEGVHAYTNVLSVAAGETIRFCVSSSYQYELEIWRLGTDVNSVDRDQIVHSFGPTAPRLQPIHPGSYLHIEKRLDPQMELAGLTLEIWIRRWRTQVRQALISQLDQPDSGGFALFVNQDGSLGFYAGAGGPFREQDLHTTAPDQLKMTINPQGLQIQSDNTPSSVLSNQWHHVVACYGGDLKQVWVDGKLVASWKAVGPIRPGKTALRIGASAKNGLADCLLDADIAMPAILRQRASAEAIAAVIRTRSAPGSADRCRATWLLAA